MIAREPYEIEQIAELLEEDKQYTIVGHTRYGIPFHHQIIARRVELKKEGHWQWQQGQLKASPTLYLEAEHPADKKALHAGFKARERLFNTKAALPNVYILNAKECSGFAIYEGWHPETQLTDFSSRMVGAAASYNKNMPLLQMYNSIPVFDEQFLNTVTEEIGVEPIAYFMVNKRRIVLKKNENAVETALNPPRSKKHGCKYGCGYQHDHRGAMNLHEHRCKIGTLKLES